MRRPRVGGQGRRLVAPTRPIKPTRGVAADQGSALRVFVGFGGAQAHGRSLAVKARTRRRS
jgi:hypothetical protein